MSRKIEALEPRKLLAGTPIYTGGVMGDAGSAHDGNLRWAVGVQHTQIIRSAPGNTGATDGLNWDYRHHPFLAHWGGRFWAYHLGGQGSSSATQSGRLNWSSDGLKWNPTDSATVFTGAAHQRVAFYVSANNRLLVSTWFSTEQRGQRGSRIVREVYGPNSFGPIYVAKHNAAGAAPTSTYSMYTASTDTGFKTAVAEMLANKLYTQQWQEEDQDPNFYLVNSLPDDPMARAFNWWTTSDNKIAGVFKGPYSFIADSWTAGQVTPVKENAVYDGSGKLTSYNQLGLHGSSKIWGQRTEDGKWAVIGNAPGRLHNRWPQAISTSTDGKTFNTAYLALGGDLPQVRYPNATYDNKDAGLQYIRGILPASGSSPGNGNPAGNDIWVIYSSNKEDIWIAKVPTGVTGTVSGNVSDNFNAIAVGANVPNWNTRSIQWGGVAIAEASAGQRHMRLQDSDPHDQASAVRVFQETSTTTSIEFKVRPAQANTGRFEVDVMSPNGRAPIRLAFDNTGKIFANNGTTLGQIATYAANAWVTVKLDVNVTAQTYTVTLNGSQAFSGRAFREQASSVQRLEFRTGTAWRNDFTRRPNGTAGYVTTTISGADTKVTNAIFDIDDVIIGGTTTPPTAQPYGGTAPAIASTGTTTVQAENYDTGGQGVAYSDNDSTNNGNTYRTTEGVDLGSDAAAQNGVSVGWVNAGEWQGYTVNVQQAGTYNITIRYNSGNAGGGNVRLEFGPKGQIGGTGVSATSSASLANTGGWSGNYQTVTLSNVSLNAGEQWMRLVHEAGGYNIDSIAFTRVSGGPTPYSGTPVAIAASGSTTVEAENFDNGGSGISFLDVDAVNNGGDYRSTAVDIDADAGASNGHLVGWTAAGEWLGYTLNVLQAGAYDLVVRYNSGNATAGTLHAQFGPVGQVGGAGVTVTPTASLASTGGWVGNFQTATIPNVTLAAGTQWLRIVQDTGGYNIDSITLTPRATAQRNALTTIEAESLGTKTGDVNVGVNVTSSAISALTPNDYAGYAGVDFGTTGVTRFRARVAVPTTGHQQTIQIRLGGVGGTLVGTYTMQNTGSWSTFAEQEITLTTTVTGIHDLYFVVPSNGISGSGAIDWFRFS